MTVSSSNKNNETCYNHQFTYNATHCTVSITCASNTLPSTSDAAENNYKKKKKNKDKVSIPSVMSSLPSSPLLPASFSFSFQCSSSSCTDRWDMIHTMMKQEKSIYYDRAKSLCTKKDPWRRLMIQWMSTIIDVFDIPCHILSVAVYYLDAIVAKKGFVKNSEDYKLVSVTVLQLAIKVYDYKLFPLKQLLSVSNTRFTVNDVSKMERRIITALQWMLHPPTFDCFVQQYSTIIEICGCKNQISKNSIIGIERTAKEMSRIVIVTELFRPFRPSVIAYAAIIHSIDKVLRNDQIGKNMMHEFTREMKQNTNLTIHSDGFAVIFNELRRHMDMGSNATTLSSIRNSYGNTTSSSKNTSSRKSPQEVRNDPTLRNQDPVPKQPITRISSPCTVSEAMHPTTTNFFGIWY